MPENRAYDVSGWTDDELERAKRDLRISLALAMPGSPVAIPIEAHLNAIDAELARRTAHEDTNP